MKARQYQKSISRDFGDFLDRCAEAGLLQAFLELNPEGHRGPYMPPDWQSADFAVGVPQVTLQAPTGAGKTSMGADLLGLAANHAFLGNPSRLGIILAPTSGIVDQTLRTYRDSSSLAAQQLRSRVGPFLVVTIDEALRLRPSDFYNTFVIIVASYDAFRREDQQSLRVYRDNGQQMDFFSNLSDEQKSLLLDSEETVRHSLVNMIRLHRPIIIADESHHNTSPLSQKTIEALSPRMVLAMTATPRAESNVICRVNHWDVLQEHMISLPLNVFASSGWRGALADGVAKRDELQLAGDSLGHTSRKRGLVVAERATTTESTLGAGYVSVYDAIEELVKQGVPRDEIAVCTGAQNDLLLIDLQKDRKIKYIITVKAGVEGLDSPETYVLVVLGVGSSSLVAEQMIGRIIRREGATEHPDQRLNESYVYCGTPSFHETVSALKQGLEKNGYSSKHIVTNGSGQATPARQELPLKEEFSQIRLPALFETGSTKRPRRVEDTGHLIEMAKKRGVVLDTAPLDKTISRKKKESAFALGIEQSGGVSLTEKSYQSSAKIPQRQGDRQRIISSLATTIKIPHAPFKDVRTIVEKTIEETYSGWSAADLWVHIKEIETQIKNQIILRMKWIIRHTLKSGSEDGGPFEIKWVPLAKTLRSPSFDASGLLLDQHIYSGGVAPMNSFEIRVAEEIARLGLPWMRNGEKDSSAFALPGVAGMHYPDFVVFREDKTYIIESKGDHLLGSQDTRDKLLLGRVIEDLSEGQVQYILVTENGTGAEETAPGEIGKVIFGQNISQAKQLEVIS